MHGPSIKLLHHPPLTFPSTHLLCINILCSLYIYKAQKCLYRRSPSPKPSKLDAKAAARRSAKSSARSSETNPDRRWRQGKSVSASLRSDRRTETVQRSSSSSMNVTINRKTNHESPRTFTYGLVSSLRGYVGLPRRAEQSTRTVWLELYQHHTTSRYFNLVVAVIYIPSDGDGDR